MANVFISLDAPNVSTLLHMARFVSSTCNNPLVIQEC
jgi:hypothetical protein